MLNLTSFTYHKTQHTHTHTHTHMPTWLRDVRTGSDTHRTHVATWRHVRFHVGSAQPITNHACVWRQSVWRHFRGYKRGQAYELSTTCERERACKCEEHLGNVLFMCKQAWQAQLLLSLSYFKLLISFYFYISMSAWCKSLERPTPPGKKSTMNTLYSVW